MNDDHNRAILAYQLVTYPTMAPATFYSVLGCDDESVFPTQKKKITRQSFVTHWQRPRFRLHHPCNHLAKTKDEPEA